MHGLNGWVPADMDGHAEGESRKAREADPHEAERTLDTILRSRENSPDRVHDELQRFARRSGFARNMIRGLLEREEDPDEKVQGGNTTTSRSIAGLHAQPVPGMCILDYGFDFDAFLNGEPLSL
ncbi:rnf12-b [Symbiodinium necroappetens]|uniref:Rnf12-b protein n=1 Tax=Symbiodinium necroappetens TaxID=1628268 RepID=A0A812IXN7_9DINO|nr:rnf12-b [Symbiodinium necroappetens]